MLCMQNSSGLQIFLEHLLMCRHCARARLEVQEGALQMSSCVASSYSMCLLWTVSKSGHKYPPLPIHISLWCHCGSYHPPPLNLVEELTLPDL